MAPRKVPIFLAIDVEPDQDLDTGRHGPVSWNGCDTFRSLVAQARGPLADVTGAPVPVGWFVRMDSQMEALCGAADHAADHGEDLLAPEHGDYLGLHVHATRWDEALGWVAVEDDPAFCLAELEIGLDAYRARTGTAPVRHRYTRGILTGEMTATMARAGVQVDLTPQPQPGPRSLSRTPLGRQSIDTEPPMTVLCGTATRWAPYPGSGPRRWARRARRPFAGWYLSPCNRLPPHEYWDTVNRVLDGMRVPYVSLPFRTQAIGGRWEARQLEILDALVTHPIMRRLRFADPLELATSGTGGGARPWRDVTR